MKAMTNKGSLKVAKNEFFVEKKEIFENEWFLLSSFYIYIIYLSKENFWIKPLWSSSNKTSINQVN